MIQVTGYFTTNTNGRYYKDPILNLQPTLNNEGDTGLQINIVVNDNIVGFVGFSGINKEMFSDPDTNAYNFIINKLEEWVINELTPYNPDCTFNKI